jgi:hypothetical protein
MIADALKYLVELTRGSIEPRLLVDDATLKQYAIGGEVRTVEVPIAPRAHTLGSLATLLEYAEIHADESSRIFYDNGGIVLVLDDADHRVDQVAVPFARSEIWIRLDELASKRAGEWLDHKAFVRLLRVDLAGTLPPGVLLDRVRRIVFDNGVVASSEQRGNKGESVGRSIQAKASGEGDIPEEVTLVVPIYTTPGETARYPVPCSVEVDAARGLFCLRPLPDVLDLAEAQHLATVRERLAAGKTPAFLGSP